MVLANNGLIIEVFSGLASASGRMHVALNWIQLSDHVHASTKSMSRSIGCAALWNAAVHLRPFFTLLRDLLSPDGWLRKRPALHCLFLACGFLLLTFRVH
jgi:hypothetical protein